MKKFFNPNSIPFIRNYRQKKFDSKSYWERRYRDGGNSGSGSYNNLANFKAEVINSFVDEKAIETVLELGVGDGNQLSLSNYKHYVGLDVSKSALQVCIEKFKNDKNKSFFLYDTETFQDNFNLFRFDLTLSLDVVFHLVEDIIYFKYLEDLFGCSKKYVIIYAYDTQILNYVRQTGTHEKPRDYWKDIEKIYPEWKCIKVIENQFPIEEHGMVNGTCSKFYIYELQ